MWLRRSVVLALVFAVTGCGSVAPFDYPREESYAIDAAEPTSLKASVDEWLETHPGPSGVYPLLGGIDALGARLRLIDAAEKSIDAQYFLMKGDDAGWVFAGSLLEAADRGVRVRFLIDDVFTTVDDEVFALLSAHPNIEIRIYSPVSRRGSQVWNYLMDFERANRRMHNKSFTVDNQITIVGGRNIADEYFELKPEGEFLDLDVIALGPVAADVSETFDLFWNHERSVPMEAFEHGFTEEDLARARAAVDEHVLAKTASLYEAAIDSQLLRQLINDEIPLYSASAEVITDDPGKLTTAISEEHMVLVRRLAEIVESAKKEVIVVTPYLVPTEADLVFWRRIVANGVRVVFLTNSLASNNHKAVYSGYSGWRKRIVDTGAELYETRADAVTQASPGQVQAEKLTLHTKAMVIDRRYSFIGSLNLDPRSIEINSEMGLVIDSVKMSERLAAKVDARLPEIAYRVERGDRGNIIWREYNDGVETVHRKAPLTSAWERFTAFVLKIVPNSQL